MSFLTRLSQWIVATLEPYGAPGLMLIAIADSSFLSLPEVNDAALMALSINNPARMLEYASMTMLGSVIGCCLLHAVGRRGGEALLRRRFAEAKVVKARGWYQRFGMLAVIVPSLLPPPLPFKIFVLSSGAFKMPWPKFILSVAIGRSIRYFTEGILAVMYGRQAIQLVAENSGKVGLMLAVVILLVTLGFFYFRRRRSHSAAVLFLVGAVAVSSGCVRVRTVPEAQRMLPSNPFTRQQALDKLRQMSGAIQSLQAPIMFEGSTASLKEEFKRAESPSMTGTLIMERPGKLFLTGRVVVKIFEMVSDGSRYQVFANQKNELYEGSEDGPPAKPFSHLGELTNQFVNMRPKQVMEALLPDVRPLLDDPLIGKVPYTLPVAQDRRAYFIVGFIENSSSRLLQQLWFDLSTANVDLVRRITFDRNGAVSTDTHYSGHQQLGSGSVRYPSRIDVQFAATETALKITLDPKTVLLNGEVDRDAFNLSPRPGAKTFNFEPVDAVSQQR